MTYGSSNLGILLIIGLTTMLGRVLRSSQKQVSARFLSGSANSAAFLPAGEVSNRVLNVVKSVRFVADSVQSTANFNDLGFDSMTRKELWVKLEDEFCVEVSEADATDFLSVEDVTTYFSSHPKAR